MKCQMCDGPMVGPDVPSGNPQYHMNTATRAIKLKEGGDIEGNFIFTTDLKTCRQCFWRSVQKIADVELIRFISPADFKKK